jgi:hypothetical protein
MQLYKIAAFKEADQFLQLVAHARGKLRKGGTPDMVLAAKVVLQVGVCREGREGMGAHKCYFFNARFVVQQQPGNPFSNSNRAGGRHFTFGAGS